MTGLHTVRRSSNCRRKRVCEKKHRPLTTAVEVVDPICLNVKLVETCDRRMGCDCDLCEVPNCIHSSFDDEIVLDGGDKRIYITLGQFSLIRLERDTQLVIPCYDFCMPEKECIGSTDDNPCELFKRIKFPVDEFFPPEKFEDNDFHMNCCN